MVESEFQIFVEFGVVWMVYDVFYVDWLVGFKDFG